MNWKAPRARPAFTSADPFANLHPQLPTGAAQRLPPSPHDRSLDRAAVGWLHALPAEVRPHQAPIRFPRILNRLARYWDSPSMTEQIFDDLLVDRRVGRKGFPRDVLVEIHRLHDYYRSLHPPKERDARDLWASVPDRLRKMRR
jgi:hypothetical protein